MIRFFIASIAAFIWFGIGASFDYTSDAQALISMLGGTAVTFCVVYYGIPLFRNLLKKKK